MAAGSQIGDMFVRISGDDGPFNAALARVHGSSLRAVGQLQNLENRGSQSFSLLGMAAAGAAGAIVAAFTQIGSMAVGAFERLLGLLGASVKLASDFTETSSKFGFLFTTQANRSKDSLNEFGKTVGRSRTELYAMAADFMGVTRGMTSSQEEAAKMAVTLARLSVDLGSFNNTADSEAAERLQSGLIGNHEALRKLNVFISEATIRTELMRMGFKGTFEEATDAQKQLARLNIVLRETGVAQGDAERTSGSFSNQMKALWASLSEAGLELGNSLVPSLQVLVSALIDGINILRLSSGSWQAWGATVAAAVQIVMNELRQFAFTIYNYDLLWEQFKLTAYRHLYGTYERVAWFGQTGLAVFQWFFENAGNALMSMAENVITVFTNMAGNLTEIFTELWDYIASGGENAVSLNLKNIFEGLKKAFSISGLKLPEMKDSSPVFDALQKALDQQWKNRASEVERKLNPEKSKNGKDELGLPGLGQGASKGLKTEITSNEQLFRKALVDNLKAKQDAQMLQTNQAQLAELKQTRQDQASQHTELVAAVKGGGFAFT